MVNNISFLRSIKPKYGMFLDVILIISIGIIILAFKLKCYDVYFTNGYIECSDSCKISFSVDYLKVNSIINMDKVKINKENKDPRNIIVSDILLDENSKSNYQIISFEVDQLDNGMNNIFGDVRIYSNYELIIDKIIKFLF